MKTGEVTITVTVPSATTELPEEDGFAWQVLSALTTHAELISGDGTLAVTMTMNSTVDA